MLQDDNIKLCRELVRSLERKLGYLEEEMNCCGVSMAQCHALVEIGRAGEISLSELSKLLNLDSSTLSRTVNNLVNNAMVERQLDPQDRRYVTISLTPEGKAVFEEIETKMEGYYKKIYEAIPAEKQEQVLESLKILLEAISESECC